MAAKKPSLSEADDWEDDPADWEDEAPPAAPTVPEDSPFAGAAAQATGERGISNAGLRGAVASALQGVGRNWADEAAGTQAELGQILKNWRLPPGERIDPRWTRRNARDSFRAVEGQFREENSIPAIGLNVLGNVATSPLKLGNFGTFAEGMLSGAGTSDELNADTPRDMLLGGALAMAGKNAGELVGEGLGAAARGTGRLLRGAVQPSAAARLLQGKGVDNLTIGQMAPDSFLAQMEEAGTSTAGIGPAVRGQREAARAGWQQAVLNEAIPPGGAPLDEAAPIADRLARAYSDFAAAYAPAKGIPIASEGLSSLADAADNPAVLTIDETRKAARRFLLNQLTQLRPDDAGNVTSDQILAARSAIREAVRDSEDPAMRRLMQTAADDLTNTLDAQLPPQAANALRAADARYGGYKVVEDTVRRAGDQLDGFSPSQLSSAIRSNTQPGAYARGAGGPLRDLAKAGKETLDVKVPMTGARLLAAGPVPYVTGPMSYIANLPGPKRFLTGQQAWQQSPILAALAEAQMQSAGPLTSAAGQSSTLLEALLTSTARPETSQQPLADALRRRKEQP